MEDWKLLTKPFNNEIKQVIHTQHLAVQLISVTGRYLIPERKDQDNIAMQFVADNEMFLGKQHPDGWLVGLKLRNLVLQIRDDNMKVASEIPLKGKTFPEVLIEYKKELHKTGTDVSFIRTDQPYELPVDSLVEELFFRIGTSDAVNENIYYRHNASLVLHEISKEFAATSPVYTWPNHFDTGFSFPVKHNIDGNPSITIGMGWAIPDSIVDEPYYYLSFLSDEPVDELALPGQLTTGQWMMPRWNGAVLKLSEMIIEDSAEKQLKHVKNFFESGVNRLTDHIKFST